MKKVHNNGNAYGIEVHTMDVYKYSSGYRTGHGCW